MASHTPGEWASLVLFSVALILFSFGVVMVIRLWVEGRK